MPRIHRADLHGRSLEELKVILRDAVTDGSYSRHDIDKVLYKIEKRIAEGHTLADDDAVREILKENLGSGGFE